MLTLNCQRARFRKGCQPPRQEPLSETCESCREEFKRCVLMAGCPQALSFVTNGWRTGKCIGHVEAFFKVGSPVADRPSRHNIICAKAGRRCGGNYSGRRLISRFCFRQSAHQSADNCSSQRQFLSDSDGRPCHWRTGENPDSCVWTPAFAGVTVGEMVGLELPTGLLQNWS
jgi:hypothetical protein